MRAITVVPERRDSVALTDMPEPPEADGPVLVETRAVGVCGTDLEIINGEYGQAPPGADRLVIGHESLGRVIEAPAGTGLHPGDLVVGIVRRRRLLAALLSVQRGFDTHVFDRAAEGRKPAMVSRLGATYHHGDVAELPVDPDIVVECTGFPQLLVDAGHHGVHQRITCLTGVSAAGAESSVDIGRLNRQMVLQNGVLFGSVNANRRHYELAAGALASADPGWLAGLLTRRVAIGQWPQAYTREPEDIKTTLHFASAD